MTITFEGLKAGPKTLQHYNSDAVTVQGRIDVNPPSVEYNVGLLSQSPGEIKVENEPAPVEKRTRQVEQPGTIPALTWTLIILTGLAAGALVYFFVIKRLSGGPSTPAARRL
jgi:hypothetical protein